MATDRKGLGLMLLMHPKGADNAKGAKAGPKDDDAAEGSGDGEAVAQEVLDAVARKDAAALWEALRAAFRVADAEPHEEGGHESEVSDED